MLSKPFFYYSIKELKEEYIQLSLAEIHDNVDTSLSTLSYRNQRIAEIEKEAEERHIDISEWHNEIEKAREKTAD